MKGLSFVLILFLSSLITHGQNYVFVLVDVSKSIQREDLTNAKAVLVDILTGNKIRNATVSFGSEQDISACTAKVGDKLAIWKFGDKLTTLSNTTEAKIIQHIPEDVKNAFDANYPPYPTDNRTYLTLAKAKVAEYAKNNQISQYRLYLITDNISDDYGPNGSPDYSSYERSLAESYGTTSNPIAQANSTKLKITNAINPDFVIELIPKVDISNYNLPSSQGQAPISNIVAAVPDTSIKIISFAGGKRDKEIPVGNSQITINWSCTNCPEGATYNLVVSQYDGGDFREVKKNLLSPVATIDMPDGKFKITVSSENLSAISDATYIEVSTSGYGWIFFIFLLAALIGTGYWYMNKRRSQKINISENLEGNNTFSSPPPPSQSNNQDSNYW